MEFHNIEPVFDENSEILILGSFPSVKSREMKFFYGHPQNRFWKVIADITDEALPVTVNEKKALLLKHNIAVWDVIKSCDIVGSSVSSIENVRINDFDVIFGKADIKRIYANGDKAYSLFKRYYSKELEIVKLPSTSPANARYTLEMLCNDWRVILER